jgi:hypothetical protein
MIFYFKSELWDIIIIHEKKTPFAIQKTSQKHHFPIKTIDFPIKNHYKTHP